MGKQQASHHDEAKDQGQKSTQEPAQAVVQDKDRKIVQEPAEALVQDPGQKSTQEPAQALVQDQDQKSTQEPAKALVEDQGPKSAQEPGEDEAEDAFGDALLHELKRRSQLADQQDEGQKTQEAPGQALVQDKPESCEKQQEDPEDKRPVEITKDKTEDDKAPLQDI